MNGLALISRTFSALASLTFPTDKPGYLSMEILVLLNCAQSLMLSIAKTP